MKITSNADLTGVLYGFAEGELARTGSCGGCYACCVHLDIAEFHKPAHRTCPHLEDGRCARYDTRPYACSGFFCLWRVLDWPETRRPDICGLLAHITTNAVGLGINVVECCDGAAERSGNIDLLSECAWLPVTLVETHYRDGRRRLQSRCADWIRAFCEHHPSIGAHYEPLENPEFDLVLD